MNNEIKYNVFMQIPFIDVKLAAFLTAIQNPFLNYFFATATYSAGYLIVILVSILSIGAFALHRHKSRIFPFIITLLGTTATIYILKIIFDLERPARAMYVEGTPSFPSGHSGTAMALYGFLILTTWKHDKHHLKNPLIIFLSLLIIAVGISRLYLGVHYFADVLAGYTTGLVWLYVGNKIGKKAI